MTKRSTRGPGGTGIDEVRREIAADGVMVAYRSLKQVCEDAKAPAQARAAAGVAIFRAGGLYDAKKTPLPEDEQSEATPEQLREAMAVLTAEKERIEASIARRPSCGTAAVDDDEGEFDLFE